MTRPPMLPLILIAGLLAAATGCSRGTERASSGVIQTKFPGQVTAGGGTSGQVLTANAKPVTDATYAGGTPGIAGGSGGSTGGTAIGGAMQESGQGPSSGTTQPKSVGRPGTSLPTGDHKPAAPQPGETPTPTAVHRDPASSAAPGRTTLAPSTPATK